MKKMHYKITIFGASAPYPRLINWISSSISQGKKDDMSSKFGPAHHVCTGFGGPPPDVPEVRQTSEVWTHYALYLHWMVIY